jgi:(S)-2-hydroxyglutarate dehydrogenase
MIFIRAASSKESRKSMSFTTRMDVVVVGGGIMGLALAREMNHRHPSMRIAVIEKEPSLGCHASGRNSGVLHSGIYYPQESLKAKFCAEGARAMALYCEERGLPLDRMGKVILPVLESDDETLDLLVTRARANGARAELIGERELHDLEPDAHTCTGRALHSPDTAVIDPRAVLTSLAADLTRTGVILRLGQRVSRIEKDSIVIGQERLPYGLLVNAAGLQADLIAKQCGVGERYTMLPFKGLYYRLDPAANLKIRGLIYPVPDLRVPFLGVHFTKKIDGEVFLGPTAIPALGRENYHGLRGVSLRDLTHIAPALIGQYLRNQQGFRTFVREEAGRFLKSRFAAAARLLVPRLRASDLQSSDTVGIRAQLFDRERHELVMDFLVERGERSIHVLNAVSPGLTSAFSFAAYVTDQAESVMA